MNPRSEFLEAINQLPPADPPSAPRTATADHGAIAIAGDHVQIFVPGHTRSSATLSQYCAVGISMGVALALLGAWMLGVPLRQVPLYCTVWIGFLVGLGSAFAIWRSERSKQN